MKLLFAGLLLFLSFGITANEIQTGPKNEIAEILLSFPTGNEQAKLAQRDIFICDARIKLGEHLAKNATIVPKSKALRSLIIVLQKLKGRYKYWDIAYFRDILELAYHESWVQANPKSYSMFLKKECYTEKNISQSSL